MGKKNLSNEQERNYFVEGLLKEHGSSLRLKSRKACRDNKVDHEDLFQTFSVKMVDKAEQVYNGYEKQGKGVGYLVTMLKNTLRDMIRKENRRTSKEDDYRSANRSRSMTPEEILIEREIRNRS